MPREREEVSLTRLKDILNAELTKSDPCRRCSFPRAPGPLKRPDSDGCNWSQDLTLRRGPRADATCGEVAERAVADVSRRFNLAAEAAAASVPKTPVGCQPLS